MGACGSRSRVADPAAPEPGAVQRVAENETELAESLAELMRSQKSRKRPMSRMSTQFATDMFKALDADGDGSVSMVELTDMSQMSINERMSASQRRAEELMRSADADSDGSISMEEWLDYVRGTLNEESTTFAFEPGRGQSLLHSSVRSSSAADSHDAEKVQIEEHGFTLSGVSLGFLKALLVKAREYQERPGILDRTRQGGVRKKGQPLSTSDVCFEIVRPATKERGCAYCELPGFEAEVGEATAFVSHAWSYDFARLVSALEAADLPSKTRYWVDVCVVKQHTKASNGFDWWSKTFKSAVQHIGKTLLVITPWEAPVPLRRAWCIWEIFCTVDTGTELLMLLPEEEKEAFARALVQDLNLSIQAVCNVECKKADAYKLEDQRNIFQAIEHTCGFHQLDVAAARGLRDGLSLAAVQVLEDRRAMGAEELVLMHQLANLLRQQGDYDEARNYYEQVLARREFELPKDHLDTLRTAEDLAVVLAYQGRSKDAWPLIQRAHTGFVAALGETHKETLVAQHNLANVLRQQHRSMLKWPH